MAENRSVNIVDGKLIITQSGISDEFIKGHQSVLAQTHTHFPEQQIDYNAIAAGLAGAEVQNFCDLVNPEAVERLAQMGKVQLPARDTGIERMEAPASDLSEPVIPMTFGAPELSC